MATDIADSRSRRLASFARSSRCLRCVVSLFTILVAAGFQLNANPTAHAQPIGSSSAGVSPPPASNSIVPPAIPLTGATSASSFSSTTANPSTPNAPTSNGSSAASLSPSSSQKTLVEINTNRKNAWLERFDNSANAANPWVSVCTEPCNLMVDPSALFRLRAPGVSTNHELALPPVESVRIDAKLGSKKLEWTGYALTIAGGVAMATGLGIWGAMELKENDPHPVKDAAPVFGSLLGLGTVAVVVGIRLLSENATSVKVTQTR